MKVKIYKEYGALNSSPVFAAVEQGFKKLGCDIVEENPDIEVIWSVLFQGRMLPNKQVYEQAKANNRPVMIVEVSNFQRGKLWRLSWDNVNGLGDFANKDDLDLDRPKKLGINLKPLVTDKRPEIIIIGQHQNSLQWTGKPKMVDWVKDTINEIKKYTDRQILVRPHPRHQFTLAYQRVIMQYPKAVSFTYDEFNFDPNYHCIVNFNSGPALRAAVAGVPVITDGSSLAYPVSDRMENIDNPQLLPRDQWFIEICHTEWTIPEIEQGIPQKRLLESLKKS
jgi:hypothetical protein